MGSWKIAATPIACASLVLRKVTALPSDRSSPAIGLIDAGHDLDQCGFSGAVLANNGVNFAGENLQRNIRQRCRHRKTF